MPKRGQDYITVSPPTFDRTEFARLNMELSGHNAPYARDWLMDRFAEGLQIRLLRPPLEGYVVFQPGRLAWRPIEGASNSVVVHDLQVADGPRAAEARKRLWALAEEFASYYGYAAALALVGAEQGLIRPQDAPGRGWFTMDESAVPGSGGAARLVGRVMQGPYALPSFPKDWTARAASVGAGYVIQTTGENDALEARAASLCQTLKAQNIQIRHQRLASPEAVRGAAVCPNALYSVLLDGRRLGGAELSAEDVLSASMS